MLRRRHRRGRVLFVLTLALLAAPRAALGAGAADSGFRPKPNGFNFPNWGAGENPQGDLTVDDARCLFGDGVCERITGGRCQPTPAARMWIQEMNRGMGGGHCEGLAALSAAFYAGARQPTAYGAATAWDLKARDAALLRMISTLFTTQNLEPVASATAATKQWSTKQIVDTLARSLQDRKETYTLGIYGQEGGHAITPFSVEDLGGGRYDIHVYDNNYPGADNVVEVDTEADTWRYAAAALNPGEQAAPWEGTGGSMDLTPLSVRFEPLVCPFCAEPPSGPMCGATRAPAPGPKPPAAPGAAAPRGPSSIVTTANCDQLAVTDKKSGKKAGFEGGRLVSQIPNARMTRRRGTRGCVVELPPGAEYDVSVVGRPGQASQPFETTIFRPGQVINLDDATVGGGQADSMEIGDTSFAYRPGGSSKPSLTLATDEADGKDGYYEVDDLALGAGHEFSLSELADGRIVFDSDDPELHEFDIDVKLEDESGEQDVKFDNVAFDDHGQAILGSDEGGGMIFGMDSDSDGTIDARDADDDNDGTPDAADSDDDGDGTPDAGEEHLDDADGDGTSDDADADDDNDGTPDAADQDDDNDGTPDAADEDDDNDGTPDAQDEEEDEEEDEDDEGPGVDA